MQDIFLSGLRSQRAHIRRRWEDLLRAERCSSPLANPDTLVHLLDLTLDELLAKLATTESYARRHRRSGFICACGRNPLLTYFGAGRQAMQEALVLSQAATAGLTALERDSSLDSLEAAFSEIADREIAAFCALCQYRGETADGLKTATSEVGTAGGDSSQSG